MSGSTTGIGVWTNGAGARDAAVTPVDGSPTSGNDHFWGDALVVADAAGTGIVLGAPSDNFAEGGLGNDTLEGNQGSDTLVGGNGIDSLLGGAGDDTLIAFSATGTFSDGLVDTVAGGAGNDTYYVPASDIVDESASMGGAGVDTVVTDAARYSLLAVDGYVFGGVENLIGVRQFGQQLIGNELGNSITGGAADDTVTGGAGGDTLDGGGGTNTLNYLGAPAAVNVNLGTGAASGSHATGDSIAAGTLQNAIGSNQNDTLSGSGGANRLEGGAGSDLLDGGAGVDWVSYKASSAAVVVDLATNTTSGGHAQGDTISGFESVEGGAGADSLAGSAANNAFQGWAGNDTINGAAGTDTAIFSGARSTYTVTSGVDGAGAWTEVRDNDAVADGDDGTDRLYGVERIQFKASSEAIAPAITSITASGTDIAGGSGVLNAGKSVLFTVNASEALNVIGTPTLVLSNGANAAYSGGSGTTALTFRYTVGVGDREATDLAITAVSTPTGASIVNTAGTSVTFNAAVVGNPAGTLQIDTVAPSAPRSLALASDTGTSATDGITSNATITGIAEAGSAVTLRVGGTTIGNDTADDAGNFSIAPTVELPPGSNTVTVVATDAVGNAGGTTSITFTLDTAPDGNVGLDLTDAAAGPGGASVAFSLSGLDAGSTATVTFTGSDGGSATRVYAASGDTTADVSGLAGDLTASVSVTDAAGNLAAGAGDTLADDPVCFYPGTLVATPSGEVAVERLRAGALVLTADGRAAPVRWMGRQTVSTRFADPLRVLPVRIMAGALGEGLPARDLLLSPDHALLVDGVLVQAGALVNGTTVRREARVPEVFTYWHVELADHALVLAEGVPAETFIDNIARLAFDNWDEHEAAAAGSAAPILEMALPRAKARRQVPVAIRRRLEERTALLLGEETAAA